MWQKNNGTSSQPYSLVDYILFQQFQCNLPFRSPTCHVVQSSGRLRFRDEGCRTLTWPLSANLFLCDVWTSFWSCVDGKKHYNVVGTCSDIHRRMTDCQWPSTHVPTVIDKIKDWQSWPSTLFVMRLSHPSTGCPASRSADRVLSDSVHVGQWDPDSIGSSLGRLEGQSRHEDCHNVSQELSLAGSLHTPSGACDQIGQCKADRRAVDQECAGQPGAAIGGLANASMGPWQEGLRAVQGNSGQDGSDAEMDSGFGRLELLAAPGHEAEEILDEAERPHATSAQSTGSRGLLKASVNDQSLRWFVAEGTVVETAI